MPPLLHVMRHGQGWHSEAVSPNGHQIRDPWLTPEGQQQCRRRCESFERHDEVSSLETIDLESCKIVFITYFFRP